MRKFLLPVFGLMVLLLPATTHAVELMEEQLDLTQHFVGYMALFVLALALAYLLVVLEEQIHFHKTREETKKEIFEYIEVFYNREQIHSANDYLSPVDYENQQIAV